MSAVGAGLDPSPLASTSTVSLVEVHPSTVMVLKDAATASRSASVQGRRVDGGVGRAHGEHRGHVGGEHGGALGHAADGEAVAGTTTSLGTVSVVMMARAALVPRHRPRRRAPSRSARSPG